MSWKRYSYGWITLGLFGFSLIGHWLFGWYAYVEEQAEHGASVETASYLVEMMRDTLENWQSEFLQLLWQVCGLAFFLFLGSPQSKEETDRLEAKVDAIIRRIDPQHAEALIIQIDESYSAKRSDAHFIKRDGREVLAEAH